jgi:hypothetical protein
MLPRPGGAGNAAEGIGNLFSRERERERESCLRARPRAHAQTSRPLGVRRARRAARRRANGQRSFCQFVFCQSHAAIIKFLKEYFILLHLDALPHRPVTVCLPLYGYATAQPINIANNSPSRLFSRLRKKNPRRVARRASLHGDAPRHGASAVAASGRVI